MPKKPPEKTFPSKQSILRTLALLLLVALLAIYARAEERAPKANLLEEETQESSGALLNEGSGSALSAEEAALRAWEEKKEQSNNFRKLFATAKTGADSLRSQMENIRNRRVDHRSECAEDLREANKFTQLPIALRCYKAELNVLADLLRKERNILEQIPLTSEDLRAEALQSIDALAEAISTVINAIDSKVYASIKDMEETKQNLLRVYKEPKWLKDNQVKADVLWSWSASLAVRTAVLMEQYKETDAEIQAKLFEGLLCLEEGDSILLEIQSSENYSTAAKKIKKYAEHFATCSVLFSEADTLYRSIYEEPEIIEEPEPEPYINRRLRRHLQ